MAIEDLFCVLLKEENDISKVPIPKVGRYNALKWVTCPLWNLLELKSGWIFCFNFRIRSGYKVESPLAATSSQRENSLQRPVFGAVGSYIVSCLNLSQTTANFFCSPGSRFGEERFNCNVFLLQVEFIVKYRNISDHLPCCS